MKEQFVPLSLKVREDVIARFEKVVQATADQFGAQVDITWVIHLT